MFSPHYSHLFILSFQVFDKIIIQINVLFLNLLIKWIRKLDVFIDMLFPIFSCPVFILEASEALTSIGFAINSCVLNRPFIFNNFHFKHVLNSILFLIWDIFIKQNIINLIILVIISLLRFRKRCCSFYFYHFDLFFLLFFWWPTKLWACGFIKI